MTKPSPFSWPASQYWDGDNGRWSTFWLRVGTPGQLVRVLPSTAGQATWVVEPQGCPAGESLINSSMSCEDSRGNIFDSLKSSSWQAFDDFGLGLETNLGYNGSGTYGLDRVALGLSPQVGELHLDSQVVASMATNDFFMGVFGLGIQGTNFSDLSNPHPSFLSSLKSKNLIPSLSWGYTAGASYSLDQAFGSLTLGGFDASRFARNNVSFPLAQDVSRDLMVRLQSITWSNPPFNASATPLLPSPISVFIDSTVAQIWLPNEACKRFEDAFGLVYNETTMTYWVDDALHRSLTAANPNITFKLEGSGEVSVRIIMPYASFDLQSQAVNNARYFPLAKAANETQYTLGRTFLQEAYLLVDYERSNFSVSQARFENGLPEDIVAIASVDQDDTVGRSVIAGASAGSAVFVLLLIITVIFLMRLRRKRATPKAKAIGTTHTESELQPSLGVERPDIPSMLEIDQNSMVGPHRELGTNNIGELLDEILPSGSGNGIPELVNSSPIELRARLSSSLEVRPLELRNGRSTVWATTTSTVRETVAIEAASLAASRATMDLLEEIYVSYRQTPLDLNKSLPPTPKTTDPVFSPLMTYQSCSSV